MEGLMKKLLVILVAIASLTCTASPVLASEAVSTAPATKESAAIVKLTNVNTASATEIEKLPGVGKKSAAAIVAYRTEKGKFKTPKDLLKVKGVGEKTLEKIKPLVTFE
jgi:competence protein ComEA